MLKIIIHLPRDDNAILEYGDDILNDICNKFPR